MHPFILISSSFRRLRLIHIYIYIWQVLILVTIDKAKLALSLFLALIFIHIRRPRLRFILWRISILVQAVSWTRSSSVFSITVILDITMLFFEDRGMHPPRSDCALPAFHWQGKKSTRRLGHATIKMSCHDIWIAPNFRTSLTSESVYVEHLVNSITSKLQLQSNTGTLAQCRTNNWHYHPLTSAFHVLPKVRWFLISRLWWLGYFLCPSPFDGTWKVLWKWKMVSVSEFMFKSRLNPVFASSMFGVDHAYSKVDISDPDNALALNCERLCSSPNISYLGP